MLLLVSATVPATAVFAATAAAGVCFEGEKRHRI
jgi:hypothetical protein